MHAITNRITITITKGTPPSFLLVILLLIVIVIALPARAATQITLQATNIANPNPVKFTYSTAADNPLGAWVAGGPATFSATVHVGQTLAPGNYSVYFRMIDYDHNSTLTFSLAGTTAPNTLTLNDRDANTYWSTNMSVTTTTPGDELIVNFSVSSGAATAFAWLTTYITSDTNEIVLRDNRVMRFVYPGTSDNDNSAAVPGNHAEDSSFETAVGPFDRISRLAKDERLSALRSTNYAYHGNYSLRIPCPEPSGLYGVHSLPIDFASNKVHTISVYARSATGSNTAWLFLVSMYTAPDGYPATYQTSTNVTVFTNWQRIIITTTNLPFYPNGQYYAALEGQKITGGDVHFDCLQIEEGATATAWHPKYDFEIGSGASEPTQVFWTNTGGSLQLRCWNNSAGSLTKQVSYAAYNQNNVLAFSGTTNMTVASSNLGTATIDLPVAEKGYFTAHFAITNQTTADEISWLMVQQPPVLGLDPASYFGGLEDGSTNALQTLQRIGLKWQICLSSTPRMRWEDNESVSNVYVWSSLNNYTNYGVSILGILNSAARPSWMLSNTDWTNHIARYASNAAVQYAGVVTNWEIWNEPTHTGSGLPSLAYYVELLRIAARMLKAVNPALDVVAGGGVPDSSTVTNIHALLGSDTNKIDRYAVHLYPGNQGEPGTDSGAVTVKRDVIDALGRDVWNTESGAAPDQGSKTGARYAFRSAGRYAGYDYEPGYAHYTSLYLNSEVQSKNFITCIGYGLTKMFYFDFAQRNISAGDFTSAQWTAFDYDDTLRAKAAMLAGVFRLIDKSAGKGPVAVTASANITAFAFLRGSTPLVVWWSANRTNKTVTLTGVTTADIKSFDVFGNGGTPGSVALAGGRMPTIVEGQGSLTLSTLTNAFKDATVADRADTTAPALRFTAIPFAATIAPLTYRWLAVDDQDTPSDTFPSGIQYRYHYNGGGFTAWGGDTWVNLPSAPVELLVQARDTSGNMSQVSIGAISPTAVTGAGRVRHKKIIRK